jgi:hypothetical protein
VEVYSYTYRCAPPLPTYEEEEEEGIIQVTEEEEYRHSLPWSDHAYS